MEPDGADPPARGDAAVALVIATHNRPRLLARCLDAVASQGHSAAEVVVVDDASTAPLAETFRRFEGRISLRVLRHETPTGPGPARNDGWKMVSSPWVAFTDDDCRPDPSWLGALVATAALDAVVVGRTLPDPLDGPVRSVLDRTMRVEENDARFSTCNVLYPRDVLEQLGGFDPAFTRAYAEDTDLGHRALAAGCRAVFAPHALVYHAVHRFGLHSAIRDWRKYGEVHRLARRYPYLRTEQWEGRWWKPQHRHAVEALAGCVASPMLPATLIAAQAWLDEARQRIDGHTARYNWMSRRERTRELATLALLDMVEVASCAWASARHRTLLL
jgi:GT2 family glycosyltransferase